MSTPFRCAEYTIASSIAAVTNANGGNTSTLIRWTRRNGCGEQLIKARKLKPQLRYWRLRSPHGNLAGKMHQRLPAKITAVHIALIGTGSVCLPGLISEEHMCPLA